MKGYRVIYIAFIMIAIFTIINCSNSTTIASVNPENKTRVFQEEFLRTNIAKYLGTGIVPTFENTKVAPTQTQVITPELLILQNVNLIYESDYFYHNYDIDGENLIFAYIKNDTSTIALYNINNQSEIYSINGIHPRIDGNIIVWQVNDDNYPRVMMK